MEDFEFNSGCVKGIIGAILAVILIGGSIWFVTTFTYRIDAGDVGLLISYGNKHSNGNPDITVIPQASFGWYNPTAQQAIFEYPVALQTLAMVANSNEGQQTGDDSITFPTQDGIPLKMDVTAQWRVTDPAKLYIMMPGVPLDGNFNHDVSTKLVRQSVIHALNANGSKYAWQDIANNENAIESGMQTQLAPIMANYGIAIEQVSLGQPHYSTQQQEAINAVTKAQQDAQAAQFEKQKQQYLADAAQIQAQSQANQIKIINQQLAQSPSYLQYLQIQKWDGHLPSTLSTDGKDNIILAPFNGR